MSEWYLNCPDIKDKFDSLTFEYVFDEVWENRSKTLSIFNSSDIEFWKLHNSFDPKITVDSDNYKIDCNFYMKINNLQFICVDEGMFDFMKKLFEYRSFEERLIYYCEYVDSMDNLSFREKISRINNNELITLLDSYYEHFGTVRCKSAGYKEIELRRRFSDEINSDVLKSGIYNTFKLKEKYTLRDIKKYVD